MSNSDLLHSIAEPMFSMLQLFISIVFIIFLANVIIFVALRTKSSLSVIKWTGNCIAITFVLVIVLTLIAYLFI